MKLQERAGPPSGSVSLAAWSERRGLLTRLERFVEKTFAIAAMEVSKLRHDPTELVTRAVQPALWLLIFGEVFTRIRAIPTGGLPYLDFMAPGILAQSVLFIAIFSGIATIWERDLGIVYVLAALLGVRLSWNPLALLGVLAFVLLGAACFSTFSLIIACLVKTRERFMGIGQILTMPLFFASNAIYPTAIMPAWLQVIAQGNPLTYEVEGLRALMLGSAINPGALLLDYAVVLAVTAALVVIGGRLYARLGV